MVSFCSTSRRMTLGSFKRFQVDDYIMLGTLCFYTTLIATINIVRHTSSNLLPPGYDVNTMTRQDIDERTYGSKLILVVEQCQCVTVWAAKACLLIMYLRITNMRREHIVIWVLAGYVAFSFVFMEVFYFGVWCRPFHNYWAVPTPNTQCDAATDHLITNATFNISSDLIMLAVGLPMFLRMQLAWKKKGPVIGIFSLGLFVVLAAVLNKVYSFTQPFGSLWTYWYVRESSTALLVANLPFVWALWRWVSHIKTVNGTSHPRPSNSVPLGSYSNVDKTRRTTLSRKDSGVPSPKSPWDIYGVDGDDVVEMAQRSPKIGRGLTLNDMLRESTPDLSEDENVTPYTHPGHFYGKEKPAAIHPLPRIHKTVVIEQNVQNVHQPDRRDPSPDERPPLTPTSSVFQRSFSSQRTAGSFA